MSSASLCAALLLWAAQDGGAAGLASQDGGSAAVPIQAIVDPRALEEAAARSALPAALLLEAARARRTLAEQSSWKAAELRGGAAGPLLEATAREAQACADDARKAWQRLSPEAAQLALRGSAMAEVVALVPAAAAEPLYLDAVCSSLWARAKGVTPLLERHGELQAQLARAAQLGPELDEAGPDRELGRLLSALPPYAGGDLDAARRHFERSLQLAPQALRTRVAYAESVGIKLQDRALFVRQLRPVAAPDDKSALADKARALLQREEELFGQ